MVGLKFSITILFNKISNYSLLRLDHGEGKDIDLPECPRERLVSFNTFLTFKFEHLSLIFN